MNKLLNKQNYNYQLFYLFGYLAFIKTASYLKLSIHISQ